MTVEQTLTLQYTVHDWLGQTVWTDTQGHLCPALDVPLPGQTVVYVDYDRLPGDTLIQANVELAIDALGYPAGPRWVGRSALDADTVVSYVGTFPTQEVSQHVARLQSVVPSEVLVQVTG